jgi:hypothetical protein
MTSIICYNFKDGWLDAEELGCFKFLETATNLFWVEAQQKCESIGGYLAEPTTARSTITYKKIAYLKLNSRMGGYVEG